MPRLQMTRTVKIALFVLRVYLIVMLVLIAVKFVLSVTGRGAAPTGDPPRAERSP